MVLQRFVPHTGLTSSNSTFAIIKFVLIAPSAIHIPDKKESTSLRTLKSILVSLWRTYLLGCDGENKCLRKVRAEQLQILIFKSFNGFIMWITALCRPHALFSRCKLVSHTQFSPIIDKVADFLDLYLYGEDT